MPYYHTLGKIPKKRHIAFGKPDGGLYAEQLVGHEGFTGTSALRQRKGAKSFGAGNFKALFEAIERE